MECTADALAEAIATDIAALAASAPSPVGALVIDPFVGSGNTLFWIQQRLPGSRALGFELDPAVFGLTKRNLEAIRAPIDVQNVDFAAGLAGARVPPGQLVVAFVAPPWGVALDPAAGLDLQRTLPPVRDIVDLLSERFPDQPLLIAVQVFEKTEPTSLAEIAARCDWSGLRRYDLLEPGHNHGVLLGTVGWTAGS